MPYGLFYLHSSDRSHHENTPIQIQSTLVISNSLISNYRLSRSENLVSVLTWNYDNRYQNNVEKRRNLLCGKEEKSPLFHNTFSISLFSGIKLHIHLWNVVIWFIFFPHFCKSDRSIYGISKYFRESLGLRNNESRLYTEHFNTKKWKFSYKKFWYFFHISAQIIDCGYSVVPPRQVRF